MLPEDSFAWVDDSVATVDDFSIADDNIGLLWNTGVEEIRDEDSNITGVRITQSSDTECIAASTDADGNEVAAINYSFQSDIKCNEAVTGQGNPTINSLSVSENGCAYTVRLEHESGCYEGLDSDYVT